MSQPADSLMTYRPLTGNFKQSTIGQATLISVPLALGSLAVRGEDRHFIDDTHTYLPKHDKHEYYLQYAPAVTLLTMKAAGIEGTSTWSEMLTADAFAVLFMGGAVEGFKHIFDADRPDGTDNHAFPSGHTSTAFMTATMLHHEYGSRYPWLSVLGYGTATATGLMRIAQNRHSVSDVMAGASVGIMATELGYIVSDLIFHKSIFDDIDLLSDADDFKPSFIGYNAAVNIPTGDFKANDDLRIKPSTGYTVGIEGAWFANRYVGVGLQGSYTDMRYYANDVAQRETIEYFKSTGNLYLSIPTSRYFVLGCKGKAGAAQYKKTESIAVDGDTLYSLPSKGGFTYGIGLWLMMRAQQSLSYKLFCDYDKLPAMSKTGERPSAMSIGLQMAYTF